MKIIQFIFLSLLAAVLLSACAKHDFIDEITITGEVGPQAYWEVGSSMVNAGSTMPFVTQYFSTVAEIDRSEVWYNVIETQEKSVTSPWIVSRTYSFSSVKSFERRISQKIREYPHSSAAWDNLRQAFVLDNEFPVSGTLSRLEWVKPEVFDSVRMEAYFGEGFMQQFKDSLVTGKIIQFADYKNMMLGLGLLDNFDQFTDSTFNANSNSWEYHFPNKVVPAKINELFKSITFDQLIQGASEYNVEYKRSYSMKAIMRVYDKRGVYGTTETKNIAIN